VGSLWALSTKQMQQIIRTSMGLEVTPQYMYILDLNNVHVNLLNGHVKIHNHHVDFAEWSCK
jgi:hypothetical protein